MKIIIKISRAKNKICRRNNNVRRAVDYLGLQNEKKNNNSSVFRRPGRKRNFTGRRGNLSLYDMYYSVAITYCTLFITE